MLLKYAISDFMEDRKLKGLSQKTIDQYETFFRKLIEFCIESDVINVEEVSSSILKSLLIHYKEARKNNMTSLNTKLKYMKAFFNYVFEQGMIENNPTSKLKYGREIIKIEVFSDEQIRQMLNYFKRYKIKNGDFYSLRDYNMTLFLLGTGCRVGEMPNIRWKDISFEAETVILFGKTKEYSTIPITRKLKMEVREYYLFCKSIFKKEPEFIYTDIDGKQLTVETICRVYKRLKKIMNFRDVRLSPYTFRHTFAHRYLMNGGDVFSLQKMLRHKKLDMTERYLALWGTALKEQNNKYNPLNHMSF